jgi:acyl-CoA synthetase (AMP-forming)/AMP-acid ligase II
MPSLTQLCENVASTYGVRPALKMSGSSESLSYDVLYDLSRRAAGLLERHDVIGGDRTVLLAAACPEWIAALLGMWRAGATAICLRVRQRS